MLGGVQMLFPKGTEVWSLTAQKSLCMSFEMSIELIIHSKIVLNDALVDISLTLSCSHDMKC
jgi:hypothetical protein